MESNGVDICLTHNHLPDFFFISLTSESETNVELHPKLKCTNRNLSKIFKNFIHDNATAYTCLCTCSENYLLVDSFDYRLLLLISLHYFNVQSGALLVTVFGLPDTV